MTKPTLTELLDLAGQHARKVLIELQQDELLPIFDLRDADGNSRLVAGQFTGETREEVIRHKDRVAAFVRELIAEHKIIQYSFLSEAWMIVRKDWTPGVSPPPSEADDRIEVVIVIATDGTNYEQRRWRIKRDGEKCVDLVLDATPGETQPGGRFDSLLKPR